MSLINDALKRASQASGQVQLSAKAGNEMRPAEYSRISILPVVLIVLVVVAVFGLGGLFLMKGWQMNRRAKVSSPPLAVAARPVPPAHTTNPAVRPAPAPAPLAETNPAPRTPPQKPQPAPPPAVASRPGTAAKAPGEAAPKAFPNLKLQGICYRPTNPSAIINAKTVFKGEKIGDVKVTAIDPDSVTVDWDGQTRVLTLQ